MTRDEYNQANPEKSWKQDQPDQQATAVLGALMGDLVGLEEGAPASPEKLTRMLDFANQLALLHMSYMGRDWDKENTPPG